MINYIYIFTAMWKANILENNDLRFVIKTTEDKLNYQLKINKEQVYIMIFRCIYCFAKNSY